MNDKKRIALSSLAVSVSAAALLSLSGMAVADDPLDHCAVGSACNLGWTYDTFIWEGEGGGIYEGGEWGQGHWDYGTCGFNPDDGVTCGCGGWLYPNYYMWDNWAAWILVGEGAIPTFQPGHGECYIP